MGLGTDREIGLTKAILVLLDLNGPVHRLLVLDRGGGKKGEREEEGRGDKQSFQGGTVGGSSIFVENKEYHHCQPPPPPPPPRSATHQTIFVQFRSIRYSANRFALTEMRYDFALERFASCRMPENIGPRLVLKVMSVVDPFWYRRTS
ncbi:hypothetical protein M0804_014245 [Polistes exclamans]|nr:hypothetical protein M0804_014246 [Polistes exclamans]KAI4475547.1 hypothetical protein M0804_014245 [Polistes exclamans]